MTPFVSAIREATPWMVVVFLAVVVVGAFSLAGLISRTNATMCSLNWEAIGTCSGTVVLLVSAVVAWLAYQSTERNERIKRTTDLTNRYFDTKLGDAWAHLYFNEDFEESAKANGWDIQSFYEAVRKRRFGISVDLKKYEGRYVTVLEWMNSLDNYWSAAYELITSDLIDSDLFLRRFCYIILGTYKLCHIAMLIRNIDGFVFERDDWRDLAILADTYYKKEGKNIDPALLSIPSVSAPPLERPVVLLEPVPESPYAWAVGK